MALLTRQANQQAQHVSSAIWEAKDTMTYLGIWALGELRRAEAAGGLTLSSTSGKLASWIVARHAAAACLLA